MLCCLLEIIIVLIVGLYVGRYIYRKTSGVCTSTNRLDGKTVIITGSSSGIGKEAAKDLANRGARVILACRNVQKAEAVRDWIVTSTGNRNVIVRQLDVSDLDSVRKFVSETLASEKRLDVLVNNAGGIFKERQETRQGFELTYATNYLGHFLLTYLLLGLLEKSTPSRIISVSSVGHKMFHLDFEDLYFKKRSYSAFNAYFQSKLCQILFTKELSHRLCGKGVTVNVLHPGTVGTQILSKHGKILELAAEALLGTFSKSPELGAQTIIHLAVSNEVEKITGEYFVDCKIAAPSRKALDPGLAKKLWEVSEEDSGLKSDEKCI